MNPIKKINLLILSILIINCAKTSYYIKDPKSDIRMTLFTEKEGYSIEKRFEMSATRVQLFWGLEALELDLETILKEENVYNANLEGKAIGGLNITEEYSFLNSIFDLFTFGLYRPYTVEIEGWIYTKTNIKVETPKATKGKK